MDSSVDADLKVDLYLPDKALDEFQRGVSFDSFVERLEYYYNDRRHLLYNSIQGL